MHLSNKEAKKNIIIICSLLFAAWTIRMVDYFTPNLFSTNFLANIRLCIHFAVFIYWGLALKKRIVQSSARKFLCIMDTAMVVWLLVRSIKYSATSGEGFAARMLWYNFYMPMMVIPLMGLFAAMSFRKPNDYKVSKWCYILVTITVLLILTVLTNDFHQLVFEFKTVPYLNNDYSYGVMYFVIAVYIGLLSISTYVIILIRGRIPERRTVAIVPIIFMGISLIYVVCYALDWGLTRKLFGDMTVFFCIMVMLIWESYIQTGMIPVNSKYIELIEASEGIAIQIFDNERKLKFKSKRGISITPDNISEAEKNPIILNNSIKLSHSKIQSGHVLWQEDLSEIIEINDKLNEAGKMLEDETLVAREKYATDLFRHRLEEQNRLYDKMQRETQVQIASITRMIKYSENLQDEKELRKFLTVMTILGAYMKRRSNLLVMGYSGETINVIDVERCFEESLNNIKLICPDCSLKIDFSGVIKVSTAIGLYDFFEETVEKIRDPIETLLVHIHKRDNAFLIRIAIEAETVISDFIDEDGTQILSYSISEEVEK